MRHDAQTSPSQQQTPQPVFEALPSYGEGSSDPRPSLLTVKLDQGGFLTSQDLLTTLLERADSAAEQPQGPAATVGSDPGTTPGPQPGLAPDPAVSPRAGSSSGPAAGSSAGSSATTPIEQIGEQSLGQAPGQVPGQTTGQAPGQATGSSTTWSGGEEAAFVPLAERPVSSLESSSVRQNFSSGTALVQQETVRKLGLDEEADTPPPTIEQLQAYLRRIAQWMRARSNPCPPGRGPSCSP